MSASIDQNLPTRPTPGLSALVANAAANDDHLPAIATRGIAPDATARPDNENTGGWNAYDVWRRLIKDARDRRGAASSSSL